MDVKERSKVASVHMSLFLLSQQRVVYHTELAFGVVGQGRLELPTPRLSSVCSNQLSYRPRLENTENSKR